MTKLGNNEVKFSGEMAKIAKSIDNDDWEFHKYAFDIADQIYDLMENANINKTELAEKLDSSKAFVSKVLRGDANMTMKTLIKIVFALGGEVNTKIVSSHQQVQWLGYIKTQDKKVGYENISKKYNQILELGRIRGAEDASAAIAA
jgi:transcriptional regulator with XRE-family HTH domain